MNGGLFFCGFFSNSFFLTLSYITLSGLCPPVNWPESIPILTQKQKINLPTSEYTERTDTDVYSAGRILEWKRKSFMSSFLHSTIWCFIKQSTYLSHRGMGKCRYIWAFFPLYRTIFSSTAWDGSHRDNFGESLATLSPVESQSWSSF
jgi:hypothetical protein